jgi:hypothetical protein
MLSGTAITFHNVNRIETKRLSPRPAPRAAVPHLISEFGFNHKEPGAALAATKVAQTSPPSPLAPARSRRSEAETDKSAVSRVSQPASPTTAEALPIWKSATQQVWKPALQQAVVFIRIQKFAPINKTFMDSITRFFPAKSGKKRVLLSVQIVVPREDFGARLGAKHQPQHSRNTENTAAGSATIAALLWLRLRRAVFFAVERLRSETGRMPVPRGRNKKAPDCSGALMKTN